MQSILFYSSFPLLDLPVGAELGAVSHGSVSLSLLPGQSAGRRTPQPKTPAGFCLTSDQAGHGTTEHLLRLFLPCTGMVKKISPPPRFLVIVFCYPLNPKFKYRPVCLYMFQ